MKYSLARTKNVGVVTRNKDELWANRANLRACGIKYDLPRLNPMVFMIDLISKYLVGENGDCYDRYMVRMLELEEVLK